jgi:hypothetical protein
MIPIMLGIFHRIGKTKTFWNACVVIGEKLSIYIREEVDEDESLKPLRFWKENANSSPSLIFPIRRIQFQLVKQKFVGLLQSSYVPYVLNSHST